MATASVRGPLRVGAGGGDGTYAVTCAARNLNEVVGLVLLDSSCRDQFTQMPAFESAASRASCRRGRGRDAGSRHDAEPG